MADSAEKRRQAAGVTRLLRPCVTPNTTKDAQWRSQVGRGYILTIDPGPPGSSGPVFLLIIFRRRRQ